VNEFCKGWAVLYKFLEQYVCAVPARGETMRLDFKSDLQVMIVLEEGGSSGGGGGGCATAARLISIQTGATGDLQRLVYKVPQCCRCKGKVA